MRIGFVVDASCDLPDAFFEANGVRVLPSILELGGRTWLDERAPEKTMLFYRRFISDRSTAARSAACSAAEIRDIFLQELVLDYDRVLVISACAEFSDVFAQATEASYGILQHYRERREAEHLSGSFALRVLDSGTVCAGEAVVLCRALALLGEGQLGFEKIRRTLRAEVGDVRCLVVPGDPWYLRRRGLDGRGPGLSRLDHAMFIVSELTPVLQLAGGRKEVLARPRGFAAACALALERAREALRQRPAPAAVSLSFGGDPRVIREMPAYKALEAAAAEARAQLHFAVMSATMGVRLGPGALSVAWMDPASGSDPEAGEAAESR